VAVVISRDVTARDQADIQQPFNLKVFGTSTQTIGATGKIYDIRYMQFFQGDQIRGIGGLATPRAGRRVLAQPMHATAGLNPPAPPGPAGSVLLGSDGSMAAFVPARRAMSWQLTEPNGTPVVRERYWLSFQPGEVRVCAACHGINTSDQAGFATPQNPPEAFRDLLQYWKALNCQPGNPDLDQNGQITIHDLIPIVSALGNTSPHPLDFDCSGMVDSGDILFASEIWMSL
jgi:hypothetical protein